MRQENQLDWLKLTRPVRNDFAMGYFCLRGRCMALELNSSGADYLIREYGMYNWTLFLYHSCDIDAYSKGGRLPYFNNLIYVRDSGFVGRAGQRA